MRYIPFIGLCLLALSQTAIAQTTSYGGGPSAGQLMQQCLTTISDGNINDPACTGYLAGFIGAIRIAKTVTNDFPICLPQQGVTNSQIVTDVSSYLENNPSHLTSSARSVVFHVLTEKYPC